MYQSTKIVASHRCKEIEEVTIIEKGRASPIEKKRVDKEYGVYFKDSFSSKKNYTLEVNFLDIITKHPCCICTTSD